LDEIDKIGADYRGDPSSALLEVLDPEQNSTFRDHYLGIPYDLSQVLFITTANLLDPIQPAFLDRMEVIRLSGYTHAEKQEIARQHLLPKQLEAHGLTDAHLHITNPALEKVIRTYTRESGLRNLEREIAALCRKVAVRVADGKSTQVRITPTKLERFLGPPRHFNETLLEQARVGIATGLAWTATGGDVTFIEVVAHPGKGKLQLTGQLGDVMKESAQTAHSYARAWSARHGLDDTFFTDRDLHVHAPAGAIPKDGPSAGVTIASAVISVITGRPVDPRLAMTGEITLRGDILPIGGVKEKVLAAHTAGVDTVALPEPNRRDLGEVPQSIRRTLALKFFAHMDDLIDAALLPEGD
ncbi:MAG: S16 family serine protease, partial [Acidobacteriota bacterium]